MTLVLNGYHASKVVFDTASLMGPNSIYIEGGQSNQISSKEADRLLVWLIERKIRIAKQQGEL